MTLTTQGFYIILTDNRYDQNICGLTIEGQKAIYRGHSYYLSKRVESHIYNNIYNQNKCGTSFINCMKLDGNFRINIDTVPYSFKNWYVIQIPLKNSNQFLREKAEEAFVENFGLPLGCKR